MAHSSSGQSPSDRSTDVECSEPQIIHSTNDTETAIEALYIQEANDIPTETQVEQQLADDEILQAAIKLSYEAGSVSPVAIPCATIHNSQSIIESGETVEPVTTYASENFQRVVTDDGQQNDSSINRSIIVTSSSVQVKKGKRKQKWSQFKIHIDEEPSKSIEDDLQIPEESTDFIYGEKTIPVYIEQLYGIPIGQGSFGKVCAVDIEGSPGIRIAVKRVSRSMTAELITMKLVGSGGCQYIVDYYCALINPGTDELCMCMEFMDTSLEAFYPAMYSLDPAPFGKRDTFVRRVAHDIAFGLYYLEIKEIVHRDVKPANMLINKNAVVKLCDFGISRTFSQQKFDEERTLGTANYMPLTLAHTIQDDMWAFGISLLEIISGKHPFADWDSYGKHFEILRWVPIVPETVCDSMRDLILHVLEKQPEQRPESYSHILNKPCICDTTQMPSDDECNFVRYVIEKISPTSSSDY